MRFRSTEESRRNNEVTVLSIIETVVAVAVSIGIAFYMQSFLHILIGACVAPLLLLRTDESVAMGKRLFEELARKPREDINSDVVTTQVLEKIYISASIQLVYLIPLSLWVRVYSIVVFLINNPFGSIMSIRRNWIQSLFCTDVYHKPVELVPGSGDVSEVINGTYNNIEPESFYSFRKRTTTIIALPDVALVFYAAFRRPFNTEPLGIVDILFFLFWFLSHWVFLAFLCLIIAYSYRLSLKSTAILWLPLLLVPTENDSIEDHLKEERESALSKLSLAYSSLIIGLFSAKVFLLPHVIDWWNSLPSSKILNVWIMPEKLHSWHVAGAAGAGLNLIGYLFFYEKAVRKLESGTWSETFVRNVSISLKFVIYSILIYTIPAGIYITWKAIDFVKLPKFDWNPFPWW